MATQRANPYVNFNFLVDLGDGQSQGPDAGFEEVVLPEISIDVIEYRAGNSKETNVQKLPGLSHCSNAVFRRGLIGTLRLYQWINDVRNGNANARRTVTISLQTEDCTAVVMTWKLLRAWPVRYKASNLLGKGHHVVVEELELAVERLEIE